MAGHNEIDRLDDRIKDLRVEYERFFNGALPIPPVELQGHIQKMIRRLRNRPMPAFADQFRLTQLEARFNSFVELANRRLREREEGRGATRAAASRDGRPDPGEGIVVGESVASEAVEALYAGLCQGREAPRFDLESFRTYLDRQSASIRSKTGCREVRFRVVDEGGQMKLKARPIRPGADDSDGGPSL